MDTETNFQKVQSMTSLSIPEHYINQISLTIFHTSSITNTKMPHQAGKIIQLVSCDWHVAFLQK